MEIPWKSSLITNKFPISEGYVNNCHMSANLRTDENYFLLKSYLPMIYFYGQLCTG